MSKTQAVHGMASEHLKVAKPVSSKPLYKSPCLKLSTLVNIDLDCQHHSNRLILAKSQVIQPLQEVLQ